MPQRPSALRQAQIEARAAKQTLTAARQDGPKAPPATAPTSALLEGGLLGAEGLIEGARSMADFWRATKGAIDAAVAEGKIPRFAEGAGPKGGDLRLTMSDRIWSLVHCTRCGELGTATKGPKGGRLNGWQCTTCKGDRDEIVEVAWSKRKESDQ